MPCHYSDRVAFSPAFRLFYEEAYCLNITPSSQRQAAKSRAHHIPKKKKQHYSDKATDGVDPDWSIWYAGRLLEQGLDTLLDAKLLKSDVIYLLVLADKQQMSEAHGAHWENYYADFLSVAT